MLEVHECFHAWNVSSFLSQAPTPAAYTNPFISSFGGVEHAEAVQEFAKRIKFLEREYEPFNDDNLAYCQVHNMGQKVELMNVPV